MGHHHVGVLCEERLIRKKSISATYFEWLRLIRISLHKNWRCDNILLKTTIDELTDDANWESSEADEFSLDWYV